VGARRTGTETAKEESEPEGQAESAAAAEMKTIGREESESPMQTDLLEAASAGVAAHEPGIAAESMREDPADENADGPVYSEALEIPGAFADYGEEDGIAPASAAQDGEMVPGDDRPEYPDPAPAASGTGSAYPMNPPPVFADDASEPARTVNVAPSHPTADGRLGDAGRFNPFSTDPYVRGD
jgi:hypothetical protein